MALMAADMLRIELFESLAEAREDWRRLAEAHGNVFATWEWSSLWWTHFGRERRPLVAACRNPAGDMVALVPLYFWSERPLRVVRFVGHPHGDLLGPICGRENGQMASEALRLTLRGQSFDVFIGDWVPAQRAWARRARVLRSTGYPILRFGRRSWDQLLAERSHRFRKGVRQALRRLEREHDLRFRLSDSRSELDRDLDLLFDLHRARFADHRRCSFCGENEPFQREFALSAFERGWLRLWILEIDGVPVAADYGFRYADAEFGYQAGREPAWDRASVGSVLQVHVIRNALDDGVREYRFLQGDESYKYRYTDDDPGLETIMLGRTRPGRLAAAAVDTIGRVAPLSALESLISR